MNVGPDTLRAAADGVDLSGRSATAGRLRECADEWEADQAVIDAVLNSDPIRNFGGLWSKWVQCVFCEAVARKVEELTHEDYCARVLAELRRPDFVEQPAIQQPW